MNGLLSVSLLLLAVTGPLSCSAKLIIFGDSFSDQGLDGILGATELVNNRFSSGPVNTGVYPPAPYYQGRFTNGFVWIDTASKLLGQEVDNYACGGSNGYAGEVTVDPPFAYVTTPTRVPVRSLVQQAEAYAALNADATATGTDTVVIFTGADEYYQQIALGTSPPSSEDVISAINETLSLAYTAGARSFVVVTLPDLSKFPFASSTDSNSLSTLTSSHNSGLTSTASAFNSSNSDASVIVYDITGIFTQILTSPNDFGPAVFTNTTGPCRGFEDLDATQASGFSLDNCPDGDAYVFWDAVHPSKHTHLVIGQDFASKTGYKSSAQNFASAS